MKIVLLAVLLFLITPALALADGGLGNRDAAGQGWQLHQTKAQTTTLPYEFEPYDLDNPDVPDLPLPDLLNVPFINQVGSLALTLFALFDQYQVLGILVVLMAAMLITFWLWSFVTDTPSQVTLKLGQGVDVAGRVIDAQTESLQEGVDFYEQNSLRMSDGAHSRYRLDRGRIASNRRLSSGLKQGSRLLRRANRDFGGNPFK
jgi:hypothetical protein